MAEDRALLLLHRRDLLPFSRERSGEPTGLRPKRRLKPRVAKHCAGHFGPRSAA